MKPDVLLEDAVANPDTWIGGFAADGCISYQQTTGRQEIISMELAQNNCTLLEIIHCYINPDSGGVFCSPAKLRAPTQASIIVARHGISWCGRAAATKALKVCYRQVQLTIAFGRS